MPHRDLIRLSGGHETLARELSDRLERTNPVALTVHLHESLVHERLELVQAALVGLHAHRLEIGERAAAREDGHPAEQALLGLAQKRMAPVDRGAQRLLPLRQVAGAGRQQVERMVEPLEQRLG
jgi:hypothetical protein